MEKVIITNATKNAQLPESVEAGKAITIQLAPEGRYPQIIDDDSAEGGQREVVQVLDRQAMDALVANFERNRSDAEAKGQKYGVLVDADHSSETSTNTAAMGWVTELYVDPEKGLMAEIEPTPLGAEKINGKVYRFVSGAWTLDDDDRPQELVSIGLTNKPNLPVAPMTNAAKAAKNSEGSGTQPTGEGVTNADANDGAAGAGDGAEGAEGNEPVKPGEGGADNDNNPNAAQNAAEGENNMDIKVKLGLPEEATDADVEAAIDALIAKCEGMEAVQNALGLEPTCSNEEVLEAVNAVVNQCGDLQAQNEAAEQEKLTAEAEDFVAENEEFIPEEVKEEIKEEYIEDKEKAQETVANFRRVHERAVRNARMNAGEPKVRTAVVFRNSEAKRPSVGIAGIVESCNGDPVAINAAIMKMCKR